MVCYGMVWHYTPALSTLQSQVRRVMGGRCFYASIFEACLCPYIASEAAVLRPVLDYMLIIRVGRCSSPFFAVALARSLSSLSNGQPAETSWTGNLHPLDVPKNFILLLPNAHRTDTIHCPILFPLPPLYSHSYPFKSISTTMIPILAVFAKHGVRGTLRIGTGADASISKGPGTPLPPFAYARKKGDTRVYKIARSTQDGSGRRSVDVDVVDGLERQDEEARRGVVRRHPTAGGGLLPARAACETGEERRGNRPRGYSGV